MSEEYFSNLVMQYKKAKGLKNVDINSQEFRILFREWLNYRRKIGKKYLELLEDMGLYTIDTLDTIEVGKGKYDSLVKKLCTTIVTPYSEGLKKSCGSRVITARFSVDDGIPVLMRETRNNSLKRELIKEIDSVTYMTHNPYCLWDIYKWHQIHNAGDNNIAVGIFGSINDRDIEEKRRMLKYVKDKLYEPYKESFEIDKDSYYYAIYSGYPEKIYRRGI